MNKNVQVQHVRNDFPAIGSNEVKMEKNAPELQDNEDEEDDDEEMSF